MVDPKLPSGPPTMFIAGNDDGAKKTVTQLIESLGWQGAVSDLCGIEESRSLEPMCIVWVTTAFGPAVGIMRSKC